MSEPETAAKVEASVHDARRHTLERTIMFTDAAVAIALTLLVLPLVDVAHEATQGSVGEVLADHWEDLFSFVLSFIVVARLWSVHRELWEALADYDPLLFGLNTYWLLTIVFLPVPTALLAGESGLSPTGVRVYLGTLVAAAVLITAQTWLILRQPRLRRPHVTDAIMRDRISGSGRALFVQVLALVVAFIEPVAGLYTLVLLAVIDRVPFPRRHR
jgi:uncharacterized membrane protein